MAMNGPANRLSSTKKEKEGLEDWYEPINRKSPTDGTSNGRDFAAFLSILSIVESVEFIVRELVSLSAQLTMLRCVTVRIQGIHKAARCGSGGHCRCVSIMCSHACSLSQEYHMKRHVIPRLCSERGSVVPSLPLAGKQMGNNKKTHPLTSSSSVRKTQKIYSSIRCEAEVTRCLRLGRMYKWRSGFMVAGRVAIRNFQFRDRCRVTFRHGLSRAWP